MNNQDQEWIFRELAGVKFKIKKFDDFLMRCKTSYAKIENGLVGFAYDTGLCGKDAINVEWKTPEQVIKQFNGVLEEEEEEEETKTPIKRKRKKANGKPY